MSWKKENIKKEKLYFIIAGIATLVLLVQYLLFSPYSLIRVFLPVSLMFFSIRPLGSISLMIISIFSTFFILKGFSIIAGKENLYNFKKFIIIFFIIILIVSVVGIFFPYWGVLSSIHSFVSISVGEPQSVAAIPYGGNILGPNIHSLNWLLPSLEIFVLVLYMVVGIWILKLRKRFGLLIVLASLIYIYPGIMHLLFISIGLIFPNIDHTPVVSWVVMSFFLMLLFLIKSGGHICLSILFFKLAKANKQINQNQRKNESSN